MPYLLGNKAEDTVHSGGGGLYGVEFMNGGG